MHRWLRGLAPHGFLVLAERRRIAQERAARTARLRAAERQQGDDDGRRPWSYETAIGLLVDRGLEETEVREGSMPADSLELCSRVARANLAGNEPLRVLHVGNFVGISLAHFASLARELHPESTVVAMDPDISHRGIRHPAAHAIGLLRTFGLQDAVLAVTAFTLHQNLGNDGFDRYDAIADPWEDLEAAAASEHGLARLRSIAAGRFDLVLLDGNHEAVYLTTELELVTELLRPGGLLILDDVSPGVWGEIERTFDALFAGGAPAFERIDADGRVGIARRLATGP